MNFEKIKLIESQLKKRFQEIDEVALVVQNKILTAFNENRVRQSHFAPSNGYAYNDSGREVLSRVFAQVFGFESSIVSHGFFSGTHTIYTVLRGLLRPNDSILSITGDVYDSVMTTIKGTDSLFEYNIGYDSVQLVQNDKFDIKTIKSKLQKKPYKVVYIQRACGYSDRKALSSYDIESIARLIKEISYNSIIVVDNCYGEFVNENEPNANVDVLAGSLIKNPGAGIVQCGGYIVGKQNYIDKIANSFVAPGIGVEIGANVSGYRDYFLGLFLAPHTVAQAKKSALLFGQGFHELGYKTNVNKDTLQNDIVLSICLENERNINKFCKIIQSVSPIDSFVTPQAWNMPGYDNKVIMSAGTFTFGSTIELSADAPIRPPYNVYLQGALTYEHAKIAFAKVYEEFC